MRATSLLFQKLLSIGLLILSLGLICGCGVKGDPVPPGTPAEIGRGRPKFDEIKNPMNRKPPLGAGKINKDEDDDGN
jgi:hypothetical protein